MEGSQSGESYTFLKVMCTLVDQCVHVKRRVTWLVVSFKKLVHSGSNEGWRGIEESWKQQNPSGVPFSGWNSCLFLILVKSASQPVVMHKNVPQSIIFDKETINCWESFFSDMFLCIFLCFVSGLEQMLLSMYFGIGMNFKIEVIHNK